MIPEYTLVFAEYIRILAPSDNWPTAKVRGMVKSAKFIGKTGQLKSKNS